MATTEADTLLVKIAADTAQLRGELAKATSAMAKSMQAMAKESEKLNASLERVGNKIKASIIGALSGLSVGRIAGLARDTLRWADDTATLAERLGISTDALQELIFAGREMNVTSEEMAKGLQSFWAKVSEAATGRGKGVEILKQLGIDPKSLSDADQALSVLASKLKQFDKQSQLAAAKTFFGDDKAAQFLGLMLGDLDAARAKARELGVVIDSSLISKGEQLNKEFERVADVGLAKMRKEMLGVIMDVQTLVVSVSHLGPEFEKLANSLRNFGPLAGLRGLFEARDEARRDAEGQAALNRMGDARLQALAGPQKPTTTGTRRLNLDSGGASAAEQFAKQIQKARIEAMALRHELDFGKAAAANAKALEAFADAGGKFKPTTEQVRQFARALKEIEAGKTALAFKEIGDENARLAQIIAAEVAGNRELVAILQMRFALEQQLGRKLTDAELARAEALAKTRHQMEQLRERQQALMQDLEGLFDSMAGHAGQALDSILDKSKTVGEAMRDFFIAALRDIANEMFKLAAINPLKNILFGQNNPTIGDVGGILGRLAGGIGGGSIDPNAIPIMDSGGAVSAGVPTLIGRGAQPELFVPNTDGMMYPRGTYGGGTVTLVGSDSDKVEIGQLKAGLSALGIQVKQVNASIESRAVGAVVNAKGRGGSAGRALA